MKEEKKFKPVVDNACNYKIALNKPNNYSSICINAINIHKSINNFRKEKINISPGDIILNAVAQNLKKFPEFNSNYTTELKLYKNIHIGYIINLGRGLMTAIIKDTDKKSITQIANEVKETVLKYIREESLSPNVPISTITVTNLSAFNSHLAAPPIYDYQSSMITISSEFESLEMHDGKIIPVKKFNLTLSFDGRVADCQRALEFLNNIKDILEGNKK